MTDLRTEATLLTDVLVERLSALRVAAAPAVPDPPTGADPSAADPICPTCGHDATRTDCAGCPVCAVLAVLRGERPELTAALLDGAISVVTALRTVLDGAGRTATSSDSETPRTPETPATDGGSAVDDSSPDGPGPRHSERIPIT